MKAQPQRKDRLSAPKVLLSVAVGIALGLSLLTLVTYRPTPGAVHTWQGVLPTPASLEELVGGWRQPYSVIAVAVVEAVDESGWEPTPTRDPSEPTEDLWLWQELPYTHFRLRPERVLLDDGTIASGKPLLLYRGSHPGYPGWDPDYPMEEVGERYLYFLDVVDDATVDAGKIYFSGWAAWSRLVVDGERVTYSDYRRSPVLFAEGTPPSDFVDAVATAVATQYPTPNATPTP